MKRLLLLSTLTLSLSLVGCQFGLTPTATPTTTNDQTDNANINPNITYWVDYAIPQCEPNPWGTSLEPEAITQYYEDTLGIAVYSVEVTPPAEGLLFCQACGCPTGTTVSIQTDAAGRLLLLDNGFTEDDTDLTSTEPVPNVTVSEQGNTADVVVNDNTNTVEETAEVNINTAETEDTVIDTPIDDTAEVAAESVSLAAEDQAIQERVNVVVDSLADYYAAHGSYPDDLAVLSLSVETGDLVYTPIGSLPADYYDLVVSYSTGQTTLNP